MTEVSKFQVKHSLIGQWAHKPHCKYEIKGKNWLAKI